MALSGKMYDAVHVFLVHKAVEGVEVADVHLHERIVRGIFHVLQVGEVAGIRQFVEVDDTVFGIFANEEPHHMRADEACATGDDNGSFVIHIYR